jgi:hypothetical protein
MAETNTLAYFFQGFFCREGSWPFQQLLEERVKICMGKRPSLFFQAMTEEQRHKY